MTHRLFVVTGAPGSGKTATVEAFLRLRTPYLTFDIDWLGVAASNLAGRDIFLDRSAWAPYAALWFEVLHTAHLNGRVPVFFTPNDPNDFESHGLPEWCRGVEWLLLDCADEVRTRRLRARREWTDTMIEEAVEDSRALRAAIGTRIDTARQSPAQVADAILRWLRAVAPRAPDGV